MYLSPYEINRKQDITSWPEGDIAELTARDQKRYQRRKSAIIDYFQSELSVEEISSHHRLPQSESLEMLAQQCLLRHGDGRLWGFRALVPGVRVADCPAPVDLNPLELETVSLEDGDEGEDTAERKIVRLNGSADLAQADSKAGASAEEQESQALAPEVVVEEKGKQEESPACSEIAEVEREEEEFAERQENESAESAEGQAEEQSAGARVQQEVSEDEAADARVIENEDSAEQPAVESREPEQTSEEASAPNEPVAEAARAVGEEESDTQDLVSEEESIHDIVGEEESSEKAGAEEEATSEEVEDEGESVTQKLVHNVRAEEGAEGEAGDEQSEGEAREEGEAGDEQSEGAEGEAGDEQSEMAEQDTVEVARIEAEARRERVSAADTIVVPAAMLEALERASREADLAETETVETSVVSPRAHSNGHEVLTPAAQQERTLPALPDEQEQEARANRMLAERRRDHRQLSAVREQQAPTQPLVEEIGRAH